MVHQFKATVVDGRRGSSKFVPRGIVLVDFSAASELYIFLLIAREVMHNMLY